MVGQDSAQSLGVVFDKVGERRFVDLAKCVIGRRKDSERTFARQRFTKTGCGHGGDESREAFIALCDVDDGAGGGCFFAHGGFISSHGIASFCFRCAGCECKCDGGCEGNLQRFHGIIL